VFILCAGSHTVALAGGCAGPSQRFCEATLWSRGPTAKKSQYVLRKHGYTSTRLHGVTCQKKIDPLFIVIAVRTPNRTKCSVLILKQALHTVIAGVITHSPEDGGSMLFRNVYKSKAVPVFNYLSTMPWRHMGEWRYSSTFLDLGTRWRWVVRFTPLAALTRGNRPGYPLDRRLGV
jgi:hypothetical protein